MNVAVSACLQRHCEALIANVEYQECWTLSGLVADTVDNIGMKERV